MKKSTKRNSILTSVLGVVLVLQFALLHYTTSTGVQNGICYAKNTQISKVVYSDELTEKDREDDTDKILQLQGKDIKTLGENHKRLSSEELEQIKVAREAIDAANQQTVFANIRFAEKTVDKITNSDIKNVMQNKLNKVKEQYSKIKAWSTLANRQLSDISKFKSKENIKVFKESIQNIPEGNYTRIDLEKKLENILK